MKQATAGAVISVGQLEIRFLIESAESNGSLTMFECFVPAGARVPAPHSHDGFEETVYGLEGTATWTIAGERVELDPGQAFCIPRGAIHGFANHLGTDARFLATATPGVFGPDYFRELSEVLAGNPGGPPDPAAIAVAMRRHGLTVAPPASR